MAPAMPNRANVHKWGEGCRIEIQKLFVAAGVVGARLSGRVPRYSPVSSPDTRDVQGEPGCPCSLGKNAAHDRLHASTECRHAGRNMLAAMSAQPEGEADQGAAENQRIRAQP